MQFFIWYIQLWSTLCLKNIQWILFERDNSHLNITVKKSDADCFLVNQKKKKNYSLYKLEPFLSINEVWKLILIDRHFLFKGTLSGLKQFLAVESPLKMMKNTFYFILKALFVLKIFKFLYWLFGHVAKQLD